MLNWQQWFSQVQPPSYDPEILIIFSYMIKWVDLKLKKMQGKQMQLVDFDESELDRFDLPTMVFISLYIKQRWISVRNKVAEIHP